MSASALSRVRPLLLAMCAWLLVGGCGNSPAGPTSSADAAPPADPAAPRDSSTPAGAMSSADAAPSADSASPRDPSTPANPTSSADAAPSADPAAPRDPSTPAAPSAPRSAPRDEHGPRDVILVSIDTLRADHLGCYGYERDTSPVLDELASRATRFAQAWAPAPWTTPSHAAMLSGRHPWPAGVVDRNSRIPADVPLVAESLAATGYRTAAFVDAAPGGLLGGRRGFDRGFDVYEHAPHGAQGTFLYDAAASVDAALAWLAARDAARPFFLFLHTKSVHTVANSPRHPPPTDRPYDVAAPESLRFLPDGTRFPWRDGDGTRSVDLLRRWNDAIESGERAPADFDAARVQELVAMYDGGIAFVDRQIGRLRDGLAELGLGDDTVLIVTADHGEGFLDERFFLHWECIEPLLHVPLLVYDPRRPQGRVVTAPVALSDVAPTLLSYAGLAAAPGLDGRLLPLDGRNPGSERAFVAFHGLSVDGGYEAWSIRKGPLRVVHHELPRWDGPRSELYELGPDGREHGPRALTGEREGALLEELLRWRNEHAPTGVDRLELDAETEAHLRALGYLR